MAEDTRTPTSGFKDSVGKIVFRYFGTLTKKPFIFQGARISPRPLRVSPLLLRGVSCPPFCGGCCTRFTLDWLPSERKKLAAAGYPMKQLVERVIEFDGRKVIILSDLQNHSEDHFCSHLRRKEDARCGIHTHSPFSCDFELIRTFQSVEAGAPNRLSQSLFGRGWNMLRVDGERGARCSMLPPSPETVASVIRRLRRFEEWAEHFGVESWAADIIRVVEAGHLTRIVEFDPNADSSGGFGL